MIIKHLLEDIALISCASSVLISFLTLILICIYIRPLMSNVHILLICNTYIAMLGSSFVTGSMLVCGLLNTRYPRICFYNYSCQLQSYINHVFICTFFYSCALQAVFQLFRVVFWKHKMLQTPGVFIGAIFVQWLLAILYIGVYLFQGSFQYQYNIGSCWLSFKNIPTIATAALFIYGIPLAMMIGIYTCIIQYIRYTVLIEPIRQRANKRNLFVVKRMITLVLFVMAIGLPSGIILIIYMISDHLHSLAYHIQALTLTLGLVVESITLGSITPQIRELFHNNRHG